VFVVVYFVIDSAWKLLDTPPYLSSCAECLKKGGAHTRAEVYKDVGMRITSDIILIYIIFTSLFQHLGLEFE